MAGSCVNDDEDPLGSLKLFVALVNYFSLSRTGILVEGSRLQISSQSVREN